MDGNMDENSVDFFKDKNKNVNTENAMASWMRINSSVALVSAGGVSTVTRPPLFERRFNLLTEADYRQFEHREMTFNQCNVIFESESKRSVKRKRVIIDNDSSQE